MTSSLCMHGETEKGRDGGERERERERKGEKERKKERGRERGREKKVSDYNATNPIGSGPHPYNLASP